MIYQKGKARLWGYHQDGSCQRDRGLQRETPVRYFFYSTLATADRRLDGAKEEHEQDKQRNTGL